MSPVHAVRAFRDRHGAALLRDFAELLAIPNATRDREGIARNAAYLVARLERESVHTEVWALPDASPVVYGRLDAPGATRTLGLYVHYDGQPADPADWTHDPWEPTLYTAPMEDGGHARPFPEDGERIDPAWRIYARSAADDKAPLGALLPVLRALRESGIRPTSNLVFLLDGEEEVGHPHLEDFVRGHADELADVDVWLLLDGPVHQSGRPQIKFGVRGVMRLSLTVYGATRSLHSGHYGNWAPEPGLMLATLLRSMKDPDTGQVLIEGFFDGVAPLGDAERRALSAFPPYDEVLKEELGLARTEGEGESLHERLLLPSLTIHGLSSGDVGSMARNVIPATAEAELGIRLVKGNRPEVMQEHIEEHIRAQGYHVVRDDPDHETRLRHPRIANVTVREGYPAARTPMDTPELQPIVEAARSAARDYAGEELLLLPGLGGSLPLYLFTDVLNRPAVIVPVANHDNNQHAADENLRVGNLWYAVELYANLLTM